jgi:hypothetical protein
MRMWSLLGGACSGSISGATGWAGGLVGVRPLFMCVLCSVTSGRPVEGGESQCTEENSESAILKGRPTHANQIREQGWIECGGW